MPEELCLQCGNPVSPDESVCPYCGGYEREVATKSPIRSIDVGHANMTSSEARRVVQDQVDTLISLGGGTLFIVHGYGSSGVGGEIREAVRSECQNLQRRCRIRMWITGEKLSGDTVAGRRFRGVYPDITSNPHWDKENEGVTAVLV